MAININRNLFIVFFLGFLSSLQIALPNYINSSYLNTLMSQPMISGIYIIEALVAVFGFMFLLPRLLKRFGNIKISLFLLLAEAIFLFGLMLKPSPAMVFAFMVGNLVVLTFLAFSLDIFLEKFSPNFSTGKIRGLFLTFANTAWVLAPLLVSLILSDGDYWKIYLFALALLLPIALILFTGLGQFRDPEYHSPHPSQTIIEAWHNKNIRYVFLALIILQVFYAWMTIYTPIYLHSELGFDWGSIGLIFGVMLLPFVLIQIPAGRLADSRFGEKEMMAIGFVIMGLATITIYFITGTNLWAWMLILFGTRVGAALVEIMCDTYFFKQVNSSQANLIGFFRVGRPLAYIVGPLIATFVLGFSTGGFKELFLALGVIVFLGVGFSLSLKDSK